MEVIEIGRCPFADQTASRMADDVDMGVANRRQQASRDLLCRLALADV